MRERMGYNPATIREQVFRRARGAITLMLHSKFACNQMKNFEKVKLAQQGLKVTFKSYEVFQDVGKEEGVILFKDIFRNNSSRLRQAFF